MNRPADYPDSAIDGIFDCLRAVFRPIPKHRVHLSRRTEQRSSNCIQVGQGKLGGQRLAVLEQASITHFREVELPFDDAKRKLDDRPKAGEPAMISRFQSGSSPPDGFLNGMHQMGPFSGSLANRLCPLSV